MHFSFNFFYLKHITHVYYYIKILFNVNINIFKFMQTADTTKTQDKKAGDSLDSEEFREFYKMITQRAEVEDVFYL